MAVYAHVPLPSVFILPLPKKHPFLFFLFFKKGVPIVVQWVVNPISIHEEVGSIPGLPQWVKDPALLKAAVQVTDVAQIWFCCGCGIGLSLSSSLGTSMCHRRGPKKEHTKQTKQNKQTKKQTKNQ